MLSDDLPGNLQIDFYTKIFSHVPIILYKRNIHRYIFAFYRLKIPLVEPYMLYFIRPLHVLCCSGERLVRLLGINLIERELFHFLIEVLFAVPAHSMGRYKVNNSNPLFWS